MKKFVFLCILCVIILICFLERMQGNSENSTGETRAEENKTFAAEEREDTVDKGECRFLFQKNEKILILVNRENPLSSKYQPDLKSICNGRLKAAKEVYNDLTEMLESGEDEGYSFWIASAYRSREKQQTLVDEDVAVFRNQGMSYKEALAETYKETMPAGCSEHETGLALDILASDNLNMDSSQADSPANQWLRKNCYKYGFIVRYPENKESITGVNYEPWHLRYVGKEAARFIIENDLTLEEFCAYAKAGSL